VNNRSPIRWVIACCAAALLVGAVASASASAEACHTKAGSKLYALCIAGERIGSPTEVAAVPLKFHIQPETTVTFSRPELGLTLTCHAVTGTSQFASGEKEKIGASSVGLTKLELSMSSCEITEPSCKVKSFVLGKPGVSGSFGPSSEEVSLTNNVNPPEFGYVNLTGEECLYHGTTLIKQRKTLKCTTSGMATEAVAHGFVCKAPQGLEWQNGSGELSLNAVVELSGTNAGKAFSVIED
jgi:hypothetical protein